jgi:prolyl-tRNA synthetase
VAPVISALLKTIQNDMFIRAKNTYDSRIVKLTDWNNVIPMLDNRNVLLVPWCEGSECENTFKRRSTTQAVLDPRAPSMGAKSLCIPFEQPAEGVEGRKCIQCGVDARVWGLFGRSY